MEKITLLLNGAIIGILVFLVLEMKREQNESWKMTLGVFAFMAMLVYMGWTLNNLF